MNKPKIISPKLSRRMAALAPEGAYAVMTQAMELERRGRSIIHLEIGQPDFPTPRHIGIAAQEAIRNGKTRYTSPLGIPELREAIARHIAKRSHTPVSASGIAVTPSTKTALFAAMASVIEAGDEVIYPDPGFPTYGILVDFFGGVRRPVALKEERDFSFDMHALRKALSRKTKLIIINSPSNPTGGVIPKKDLAEIVRLAKKYSAWILSDEIYARMCYGGARWTSLLAFPEARSRLLVADGFSKTYAMTGWRLGWLVYPDKLEQKMDWLLTHLASCTATFTQYAGIEALEGSQKAVERMLRAYAERKDIIVEGLNAIPGITCRMPAGAFYVFPNVQVFKKSSAFIAEYLLNKVGVALLPGTAFGPQGEGYLRLSYATSVAHIREGLARMKKALAKL